MQVITKGSITSVRLNQKVTSGREQWLQWHQDFAKHSRDYIEVDTFVPLSLPLLPTTLSARLTAHHEEDLFSSSLESLAVNAESLVRPSPLKRTLNPRRLCRLATKALLMGNEILEAAV